MNQADPVMVSCHQDLEAGTLLSEQMHLDINCALCLCVHFSVPVAARPHRDLVIGVWLINHSRRVQQAIARWRLIPYK